MARPRRKAQDSPIHDKQKALAEQEEKLRRKMEELEDLIKEAPHLAEQVENRRRQNMVIRASQPTRPAESPNSLFDKRYDANVASTGAIPRRRRKSLRAEQREQRMWFLALLAVLTIVVLVILRFLH